MLTNEPPVTIEINDDPFGGDCAWILPARVQKYLQALKAADKATYNVLVEKIRLGMASVLRVTCDALMSHNRGEVLEKMEWLLTSSVEEIQRAIGESTRPNMH